MKPHSTHPASTFWFMLVIPMVVILTLGLIVFPSGISQAAGNNPDQAFLTVQFDGHDRLVRSVSFSGTISGLNALLQTGLQVETQTYPWGTAVCSIEGVGCPASNCFCDPNRFWNYEYWEGSQWLGHMLGADTTMIMDGAIEGWRWGEWGGEPIPAWGRMVEAWETLNWLRSQQASDGGFGNMASSLEAAIALGANHELAHDWIRSGSTTSLEDYLLSQAVVYSQQSVAAAGKMAYAFQKAGVSYPGGAKEPLDYYDAGTGEMGVGAGAQSWAILGTVALSQTVPLNAIDYLKNLAVSGGGWEWSPGWGADTNTTALAIRALLAAGEDANIPEIQDALLFLKNAQNTDGGFPYDPQSIWGTDSDTDSTAYVLLALYELGEDPFSSNWRKSVPDSLDFIDCRRLSDGSFEWMAGTGSNLLATQQTIPAIFGRPPSMVANDFEICSVSFLPYLSR